MTRVRFISPLVRPHHIVSSAPTPGHDSCTSYRLQRATPPIACPGLHPYHAAHPPSVRLLSFRICAPLQPPSGSCALLQPPSSSCAPASALAGDIPLQAHKLQAHEAPQHWEQRATVRVTQPPPHTAARLHYTISAVASSARTPLPRICASPHLPYGAQGYIFPLPLLQYRVYAVLHCHCCSTGNPQDARHTRGSGQWHTEVNARGNVWPPPGSTLSACPPRAHAHCPHPPPAQTPVFRPCGGRTLGCQRLAAQTRNYSCTRTLCKVVTRSYTRCTYPTSVAELAPSWDSQL